MDNEKKKNEKKKRKTTGWVTTTVRTNYRGPFELYFSLGTCYTPSDSQTQHPNSPHIDSYTFCYFHWEKQVVNQKFDKSLISSQILLTLAHKLPVIFFGEKQVFNQKFDKNRESSATHVTQKGNFPKKSLIYP